LIMSIPAIIQNMKTILAQYYNHSDSDITGEITIAMNGQTNQEPKATENVNEIKGEMSIAMDGTIDESDSSSSLSSVEPLNGPLVELDLISDPTEDKNDQPNLATKAPENVNGIKGKMSITMDGTIDETASSSSLGSFDLQKHKDDLNKDSMFDITEDENGQPPKAPEDVNGIKGEMSIAMDGTITHSEDEDDEEEEEDDEEEEEDDEEGEEESTVNKKDLPVPQVSATMSIAMNGEISESEESKSDVTISSLSSGSITWDVDSSTVTTSMFDSLSSTETQTETRIHEEKKGESSTAVAPVTTKKVTATISTIAMNGNVEKEDKSSTAVAPVTTKKVTATMSIAMNGNVEKEEVFGTNLTVTDNTDAQHPKSWITSHQLIFPTITFELIKKYPGTPKMILNMYLVAGTISNTENNIQSRITHYFILFEQNDNKVDIFYVLRYHKDKSNKDTFDFMKNQEDAIVLFDTLNKAITEPVTSKSPILDFASFIEKYKYVNNTDDQTKTLLEIYNSKNGDGLIKTYENIVYIENNKPSETKEPNIIDSIYEDFKKEYPNILPIANAKPEIIQTPKTEVATKDTKPKTVSTPPDNKELDTGSIDLGFNDNQHVTPSDSSTKNDAKSSSFKMSKLRRSINTTTENNKKNYLLENKYNNPGVNEKSNSWGSWDSKQKNGSFTDLSEFTNINKNSKPDFPENNSAGNSVDSHIANDDSDYESDQTSGLINNNDPQKQNNESTDIGKSKKTSVEPIHMPAKKNTEPFTKWSSSIFPSKQNKPNDTNNNSLYQSGGDGSSSGTIDPLRATINNLKILQKNAQKIITKLSLKTDIIKK